MTQTRSQKIAADVKALLRARNPLLWVVTREEARAESHLMEAAAAAGFVPRTWDCAQGVAELGGKVQSWGSTDCGATLTTIAARAEAKADRGVWIMRDLASWLEGPVGMVTRRQLRNLARSLPGAPREGAQAIVVLTPSPEVPAELAGHATVIEWPMPDRDEIAATLDAAVASHCRDFTGAEIAAIVPEAMFAAFADGGREITTNDLQDAAHKVVPLTKTAAEKIARLREWAATRARAATRTEQPTERPKVVAGARTLDF